MSEVSVRDNIIALETAMLKEPQVEIEPTHYFADGIYAREIVIPAGTLLTGKIHRTRHLNIVSKGKIAVVTEEGHKVIDAPFTFVAEAGTKRVGFALEDTVWTTIHASQETDLVKLEDELIAPTFEALEADQKPLIEDKT
jgi:hypothetical protein